jgi:hypothetical protein
VGSNTDVISRAKLGREETSQGKSEGVIIFGADQRSKWGGGGDKPALLARTSSEVDVPTRLLVGGVERS